MLEHYDRLDVTPDSSPAEIKAAYHAKLKEFPAHQYPQEFKAIRAAYEALRNPSSQVQVEDFFKHKPFDVSLNAEVLQQLRQETEVKVQLTLEDLTRLTF